MGGPMVTAGGLIFVAATTSEQKLRAFDIDTGRELWQADLPASAQATPMTYSVGGKQYTDSLIKELDLNFDDAERVKMGKNVAGVSDEARLPVLKSVSEIILLEIQKTFD